MGQAPSGHPGRTAAGFSLIEILVVITIIGLLMMMGFGPVQNALESGRVTTCKKHLADIGQGLLVYKEQRNKGRWPSQSGIRFLLTLHRDGQISGRNSDAFLCPGTPDVRNDLGPDGSPGSSYADWDNLSSDTISYAGRVQEGDLRLGGGDMSVQAVASDDNERGPNHRFATNILYADGSVVTFDIMTEEGVAIRAEFPEVERFGLPVGPDSPLPVLRALRVD